MEGVFEALDDRDGAAVFMTMTVSHSKKDALDPLKSLVPGCFREARQGRSWRLFAEKYDVLGVVPSPEVTWSPRHGWHYHVHATLLLKSGTDEEALAAGEALMERYMTLIRKKGGRCSRKGQDVQLIDNAHDLGAYMSKGSAAWEVSNAGATKESRKGGLSPWDLAVRAADGDKQAMALFREYADCMPGTRSCVISPKIAEYLGLKAVADDDAEGVEQEKPETEPVTRVLRGVWHKLHRNGHVAAVVDAVSSGGDKKAIDEMIEGLVDFSVKAASPLPPLASSSGYPAPKRVHAPSVDDFVTEIRNAWGRKTKDAIDRVIRHHQNTANVTRRRLIMPDMAEVVRRL